VTRSAFLRNVLDDQLEAVVGDHVERGWRVVQLVPTSTYMSTRPEQGWESHTVTHWAVVLEAGPDGVSPP